MTTLWIERDWRGVKVCVGGTRKTISLCNTRMSDDQPKATTVESLRKALADLGLETRGHKPELKKRLRKAKKKLNAAESNNTTTTSDQPSPAIPKKQQPLDYYLFFDVEATCEENGGFEYPNEIIEFPIVLVDGESFEKVE